MPKIKLQTKIIGSFLISIIGIFLISQIFNFSTASDAELNYFKANKIIDVSKISTSISNISNSSLGVPLKYVPYWGDPNINYKQVQSQRWENLEESKKILFPNPSIIKNIVSKYYDTSPYDLGNVASKDERILLSSLRRLITTNFLSSYDCTSSDCKWWKYQSGKHRGVDFVVPIGTPVQAIGDGIVFEAKNGNGFGNNVIQFINFNGNYYAIVYAHLDEFFVQKGMVIKKGDIIGRTGNTGFSTTPHLHLQVYKLGTDINKITSKYYDGLKIESKGDNATFDELLDTLINPIDLLISSQSDPIVVQSSSSFQSSSITSVHNVASTSSQSISSQNFSSSKNSISSSSSSSKNSSSFASSSSSSSYGDKFLIKKANIYNLSPKKGSQISLNLETTGKNGIISIYGNNKNILITNDKLVYDGENKYSIVIHAISKGNTRLSVSDGVSVQNFDLSIQDEDEGLGASISLPDGFVPGVEFEYNVLLVDGLGKVFTTSSSAQLSIKTTDGTKVIEKNDNIGFKDGKYIGKLSLAQEGNYTILFKIQIDGKTISTSGTLGVKKFSDLSISDPRYNDIKKMIDRGVINGTNGKLLLSNNITRAEFATILARSLNFNGSYNIKFDDTSSHWAKNSIQKAAEYGLFKGVNINGKNYFYPDKNITIAEVVTVLARAKSLNIPSGKNWYDGAIALASQNNLYPNISAINPTYNATRGDAVASLSKYIDFDGGVRVLATN